jgi:hypothetical protein
MTTVFDLADMRPTLTVFDPPYVGWQYAVIRSDFTVRSRIDANRAHLFDSQFVHAMAAFVGSLFLCRRPTTVAWLVVSIGIDAINAFACWPFSHVSQKVFKSPPAIGKTNSSATILGKIQTFRIVATVLRVSPGLMCSRMFSSAGMAMSYVIGRSIDLVAAAGCGVSCSQMPAFNDKCGSTIADAMPTSVLSVSDDCEATKLAICQIDESHDV